MNRDPLRSTRSDTLLPHTTLFRSFSGARQGRARIEEIWTECRGAYGGSWLFGEKPTVADAMFAPVAQRFLSYAVALSAPSAAYCNWSNDWDLMREWIDAARREEDEVEELEVDRKSTRLNSSR